MRETSTAGGGSTWLGIACSCLCFCAAASQKVQLSVSEQAGLNRLPGHVTSGVPFPMGALKDQNKVRLVSKEGGGVPVQVRTSATWRDGSVKWLLLDFSQEFAARQSREFNLEYGDDVQRVNPGSGVKVEDRPEALLINSGPLRFSIAKTRFGILADTWLDSEYNGGTFNAKAKFLEGGVQPSFIFDRDFANAKATVLPPEQVIVEEPGPLRVVVKVSGWINVGETNRMLQYVARVHAFAGSPAVQLDFTITQMSDTVKTLWLKDFSLNLKSQLAGDASYAFAGQAGFHTGKLGRKASVHLTQLQESAYCISNSAGIIEHGFKSPGWVNVAGAKQGLLVGNRCFWQQYPKALSVSAEEIRIGLYPGEAPKPFDMDQGLAKTHEMLLVFHDGRMTSQQCREGVAAWDHPLFAIAPCSWYCDSKVFGELQPFDFDLFPDYETLTEASGDQFIKKMATGFRHWGDYYYGGEYKGTNSYMNLEYDVHHNFYCQFARTGLRKYLDTAITMAKHQADIDTNHKTGWQWKHSPRHVEIQAEFGHTFTRGLLETWYLTGNRRCYDAAIELGDYFAKQIRVPRELGNERQIGWSLISLLPVYEATWDKKYLEAARETVERLLAGLDEKGKFKIRWDNRISFFNGIAATGFLYYYRATGDERVAEAAFKVIRRARGFYPEYAGRTLEAIAWLYQRTGDPEDLDFLQRTWETTMARQISWNVMELGAPTIFTMHALPFMARSGFFPNPEKPLRLTPEQFDTSNGLYVHHMPSGQGDIWIQNQTAEPFDIVVIRKGAWKAAGEASLLHGLGEKVTSLKFREEPVVWQRQVIPVTGARKGTYRLSLNSEVLHTRKGGSYVTWDVATSRPMRAVLATPDFRGLEFVTPYLFTVPEPNATKIEIDLAGEGEGFKKALIIDPDGNVAGSMEAFIDLGDKAQYKYHVSASIAPQHRNGTWRISLQEVAMENLKGLMPYFATSQQSFFKLETK